MFELEVMTKRLPSTLVKKKQFRTLELMSLLFIFIFIFILRTRKKRRDAKHQLTVYFRPTSADTDILLSDRNFFRFLVL